MSTISVQEIQNDPRGFLRRLEAGEGLVIVEGERLLAEVQPLLPAERGARPYGLCEGAFTVPDDFDHPLPPSLLDEFEGR